MNTCVVCRQMVRLAENWIRAQLLSGKSSILHLAMFPRVYAVFNSPKDSCWG
jgi:hypothetical protein